MNQFAIIGSGQLGSRHLQALAQLNYAATVWVVDISDDSLALAKKRWAEAGQPEHVTVNYIHTIKELPEELAAVIVATNAGTRRAVIEELLDTCQVPYLLIEKFLFNTFQDYDAIGKLLAEKQVKAWVNCPRRMYPGYKSLKEKLNGPIEIHVSGAAWGLACNSIHWLDLMNFLQPGKNYTITGELGEIQPSKRSGYLEFFGSLEIRDENDNVLILACEEGDTTYAEIHISGNDHEQYYIVETKQQIFFDRNDPKPFTVLNQSQLTGEVLEQMIYTGDCELTPYADSAKLHKTVLKYFLKHYNQKINSVENQLCPIT
jgi:predicted dehydrogenase